MVRSVTFFVLILCMLTFSAENNRGLSQSTKVQEGRLIDLGEIGDDKIKGLRIELWLPAGDYQVDTLPWIYFHDGQMLFDESKSWNKQSWKLDRVGQQGIRNGLLRPFLAIAIYNGGMDRHRQYFPEAPFRSMSYDDQAKVYASKRKAGEPIFSGTIQSDAYLHFLKVKLTKTIIDSLKIQEHRGPKYLLGASMGGLISWYGHLQNPDFFKGAACLSTHWPGTFSFDDDLVPNSFFKFFEAQVKKSPAKRKFKFYFDTGDVGLDAEYIRHHKRLIRLLEQHPDKIQFQEKVFEGADHSENAWSSRLLIPLQFLVGRKK